MFRRALTGWRACALALAMVTLTGVAPARAALGAVGAARQIAVSVPSEAARIGPGRTGTVPVRIVNPGSAGVTVRVVGRGVRFGDDGKVTMTDRDPLWARRVSFPARPIAIAARSYHDVKLRVRMPARIDPDLYFIGFLVTPLSRVKANLTYVNQIGSYVTIDVPGPRTRVLAADLDLPSYAISSRAHATVRVRNEGRAAAVFWGESDATAMPGSPAPAQARIAGSLLPRGRSRSIVVEAKSSFPIALITMHIHIFYPGRNNATTREITLSKRVLLVQPAALWAPPGALLVGLLFLGRRRRKRRRRQTFGRRRRPAPSATAAIDRRLARARAGAGGPGRLSRKSPKHAGQILSISSMRQRG